MSYDPSSERVKCPKCGTKTIISRHKQDFCSNCGTELDYATLKKRGKVSLKLVFLFIVVIGILVALLPFFPDLFWFIIGGLIMIGVAIVVLIILYVYINLGIP